MYNTYRPAFLIVNSSPSNEAEIFIEPIMILLADDKMQAQKHDVNREGGSACCWSQRDARGGVMVLDNTMTALVTVTSVQQMVRLTQANDNQ